MLHCILTFRKSRIFIIFEGLRFKRPHGTSPVMGLPYRDPSFVFPECHRGYFRIWKLNDRPIWYSFGKAGHDRGGMCEPPRSWNTAQKAGPGTWLCRTAAWTIVGKISFVSFLHRKARFGNIAGKYVPAHLVYHNGLLRRKGRQHCHRFPTIPLSANSSKSVTS